jgi:MFS family permease
LSTNALQNTSVWLALRNRVFVGLWTVSVVSGCCIAAHDTAATWLMNTLGASPFLLSVMATCASLPFFLLTLPAGTVADLVDRRRIFLFSYLWLAGAAGLLAVCTWLRIANPWLILGSVFLLGIGFAINAPVWASVVPDIVRRRELASAITLGGVQMNMAGIIGPAIGGFLLAFIGPGTIFALNSVAFLLAAAVIARRYRDRRRQAPQLENFLGSFATVARYLRYTPGMQVILARDLLFALFISVVPALIPVVALRHLHLQAQQLGMVFTSLGVGSLLGATVLLPFARAKFTPNALTILAGVILILVFLLMALVQDVRVFPLVAILAGMSWTVSASELWVAGQRAMPDWARGRMNAVHMMLSQGGVALGGVLWGWAANSYGIERTLIGGTILLFGSLALAVPLSINFSQRLDIEPAPLFARHDFPLAPGLDEGPVVVTIEFDIAPQDREEFLKVVDRVRLAFLRNGAFSYRVDENLETPGRFRTEMFVSSWAEHLRQHARITREENDLFTRMWEFQHNGAEPIVRHYVGAHRSATPLLFGHPRSGEGGQKQG